MHLCETSWRSPRKPRSFWLDWLPLAFDALSVLLTLALTTILWTVRIDRESVYTGVLGLALICYTSAGFTFAAISGVLTLANMSVRVKSDAMRRIVRNGWLVSTAAYLAMLVFAATFIQVRLD